MFELLVVRLLLLVLAFRGLGVIILGVCVKARIAGDTVDAVRDVLEDPVDVVVEGGDGVERGSVDEELGDALGHIRRGGEHALDAILRALEDEAADLDEPLLVPLAK